MTECRSCAHAGVCFIKNKLEEQTILKFPDARVAVVESVVISCDHFSLVADTSTGYPASRPEYREPERPHYDEPGPPAPNMRPVPQVQGSEVLEFTGDGNQPMRRETTYAIPDQRPAGIPGLPPSYLPEPTRQGGPVRLKLTGLNPRR